MKEAPTWSPDGAELAFHYSVHGGYQIANDAGSDEYPAWSPDGTRIVFVSDRPGQGSTTSDQLLWTMNSSDGGQAQITFQLPNAQTKDLRG